MGLPLLQGISYIDRQRHICLLQATRILEGTQCFQVSYTSTPNPVPIDNR